MLTVREQAYYERHLMIEDIGVKGQLKLKNAKVLIIGAGGLGCPALLYLASAGVGSIGIVDFDVVSESNLARQILYTYEDIGQFKAEVAAKKLRKINPFVNIQYWIEKVDSNNIEDLINKYDYILDAPDNFETRYLIEDTCTKFKKTIIHGSVLRFQGQVAVFTPTSSCYRCNFPDIPDQELTPTCSQIGIFGGLTSIIGVMQAMETIKLITNVGEPLVGKLLYYNSLNQSIKKITLDKNKNCSLCSNL